jgi:nitroreductase
MSEGLLDEIERRRAKRAIDASKRIPKEVIDRVVRAGILAPSCFNNQPWRFVIVDADETLRMVKSHLPDANYWVNASPCIILALTETSLDCNLSDGRAYALFDTGLAVQNMVLQAVREGLYAHPIAGFKPKAIKKEFGIPEEYTLITLVVLGYPGNDSGLSEKHRVSEHGERERKTKKEVVFENEWVADG